MRSYFYILVFCLTSFFSNAQENTEPEIIWGNTCYYNLNIGESIYYNSIEIKLLEIEHLFNKIKVDDDTLWMQVSQRTLPVGACSKRLFVADNKNLKAIDDDGKLHGLLTKDALICLSEQNKSMLNEHDYFFPVSFNDGFLWNAEEDSYMFSYLGKNNAGKYESFTGIGIDLHDARGIQKHWIVALEKSTVVWVEDKKQDKMDKQACVLLKSGTDLGIYYVYDALFKNNIEVKKGQKLVRGELIGTAWGDENWGHLQFAVVKSDSVPSYANRYHNTLNFFPQFYDLYFNLSYSFPKSFTRGKLDFGKASQYNRNQKNLHSFEEYSGKGWLLGKWNKVGKVESIARHKEGNARLRKVLFAGERAKSTNPNNYFDYEINVKNGVYRVRAKVGDLFFPSWQKIDFEGVKAATYSLDAGEQKWTTERVVKITDRKLTVRIYIDSENNKVAGLSEIVFQRAY